MKCSIETTKDFKTEANKHFPDLKIVTRFDDPDDYNKARTISNARLDLYPCIIAYCSNENEIAFCVNYCRKIKWPLRVRSGGHQHEGMCSGNDVFIIDLSKINRIHFEPSN